MLTIADCRRRVQIEFFLGTKRERRRSLAKINLLMAILTRLLIRSEIPFRPLGYPTRNKGLCDEGCCIAYFRFSPAWHFSQCSPLWQ